MFNQKSITTFNNMVFSPSTICAMATIHATIVRLYQAAEKLRDVKGQSAVGRLLSVTPQVVKNWEQRGLSNEGALLAQKALGCDANWLLEGIGEMRRNAWTPRIDSAAGSVADSEAVPAPILQAARWPFVRVSPTQYSLLND
ncbi:MAG: hypothetical protein JWQ72_1668, partial [Polaromonas sp.]|nr:hypothetical protein [Polaromonas sp.]